MWATWRRWSSVWLSLYYSPRTGTATVPVLYHTITLSCCANQDSTVWWYRRWNRGIFYFFFFLGLPDPYPLVRGMDPDPSIISKNCKKRLDSYCIVTSFGLFISEKWCKWPLKSTLMSRKTFFLNYFFVGVLKVNDENSRIRFRIH